MSEIKTVLNFFDKNNGLKAVLKDLKSIKKLQAEINNQKGGVSSDNLKERTAALKEITRLQKQLDAERKKAINTGKQAVGIEKELVKVQEQDRKVKKQLKVARTEKFRQLQETNLALRNQKKLVKADIVENSKLSSVYERQSAKLNRLRKELKNLILTEGESSAKTKKLALEVGNLDKKLKGADAAAGQFQRNVGNYPKGLSKAVGALKNFAGALGITAGVAGLVRALGNAITIAKDFEQGNANLAAVLGKTKDQVGALTSDAKRLGAATAFSATQVSGLQVEFAKLGFNEQEILNATEATLSLAAATGSDLGEAAAIAGATLGGFGLGAEETQRVVDVMAKSFSTSALDIEKFKESMKNAAPAAKAVGISVEETTALLGTLANAGISGSKAGNNLKTSFINLNKAGLTLEEGLEKVAKSEDKLGTAAKLVGKNAAASFLVLSEGVDVTKELTKGLNNAGGAAEKMAKEQLNTLQGSLTILNSAWEGFVLGLLSGDSAFSSISRSIVEGTTAFLGMITATEDESDALAKQQIELNNLVGAITNVNNTEKTRKKLIEELNLRYPEFLKNLDQEKVTNEELVLRLKDVNAELTKKIIIKKKEEELTKLISEQVDLRIKELDLIKKLDIAQKAFNNSADVTVKSGGNLVNLQERYAEALNSSNASLGFNRKRQEEIEKQIKSVSDVYDLLNPKIDENGKIIAESTIITEDATKATKGLTDAQKAALELEKLRLQGLINEQKELDEFLNAKEKAENDFFESQLSKEEQEIRAVEEKYFNLLEQGKQFNEDALANGEELVADLTKLAEDEQSQIAAIKKKYRDEEASEEEKRLASLRKQQEEGEARVAKEEAEALAKSKKAKEEAQKEAIDLSKELVDTVIDNLTAESEAKIESLDRQINAEESFLSDNKNLSAREIEFRREKAAELEAERIEEQKRLEKLAKVQAFFDLVAAFASSGDGQGAIGKAAAAIGAGEAIAQGFHDGGYTGDGNEYKEAGVVHKGEFVNTKAQTTEYGMKGWKAKDFDKAVTDGYFNQFADANIFADQNAKFLSVQNNEVGYDFKNLESKLDSVVNAVNNSPTTDFEINGEYFIKRTHRKGGTTTKKRKLG